MTYGLVVDILGQFWNYKGNLDFLEKQYWVLRFNAQPNGIFLKITLQLLVLLVHCWFVFCVYMLWSLIFQDWLMVL